VAGVLVEDLPGVLAVVDQQPVSALLAYRADEAFRVGVAVEAAWRDLDYGDALAGEDRVESGGELRVPVPDEVGELRSSVVELSQELAGLLGGPGRGGVGGHLEDVHGAGFDLHDEQGVQALQADGVDGEEVRGKQAVR
jgi:hypothetical protein